MRIHSMANRALSDADWNVIEDLAAHERYAAVLQLPVPRWTARFAAELESDPVMAGTRRQARWYRIVAGIHDQPRALPSRDTYRAALRQVHHHAARRAERRARHATVAARRRTDAPRALDVQGGQGEDDAWTADADVWSQIDAEDLGMEAHLDDDLLQGHRSEAYHGCSAAVGAEADEARSS